MPTATLRDISDFVRILVKQGPYNVCFGNFKGDFGDSKICGICSVPIGLMYFYANNAENLQKFMGKRQYVVYPPEAPRPPSPEEMREMARELARKRDQK